MGDAEIHFIKGAMYQGLPMGNVFIFSGEWEFKIRPESEEERLTLQNLVRSDTLKKESQAGVFIFNEPDWLAELPAPTPASELADDETRLLYDIFQKKWGMLIPFFNELWYFPFAGDFNAAFFFRKAGKSYYRYIFNSGISPDTSLVLFPENKFYLNYNAVKGLKFSTPGRGRAGKPAVESFLQSAGAFPFRDGGPEFQRDFERENGQSGSRPGRQGVRQVPAARDPAVPSR